MPAVLDWLLASDEPWTRYRALVDLLGRSEDDADVEAARAEMLAHPQVQALIAQAATWGEAPIKRHNDAGHALYAFSVLADFGVRADDPGVMAGIERVLAHQAAEGAFESVVNIATAFGGTGEDAWAWLLCDAPTLLYALLALGLDDDPRVQRAVEHLLSAVDENGWRCKGASSIGAFRGPGRRDDPCPIVNVYALKVLAQRPNLLDSPAARLGAEMLLSHWAHAWDHKLFMFGVGSNFRKLKYPFVWYDSLHVVDVLSRFPFVRADARFKELVTTIAVQADTAGRYTATSMYTAWKGWSFADKKQPSPWLTFLVYRVLARASV